MKVKDITSTLEDWAPKSYQESYDNSGLIIGDSEQTVKNVLITLDVTEEVINEAVENKCELIVAHHPLIFKGLKSITDNHWVERCVKRAIKNDISIYAIHTNLDNVHSGVNAKIAEKIGLTNTEILSPKKNTLLKLTTFVPTANKSEVLSALFEAGAGEIGAYDNCSFQSPGVGTFRPLEEANPTVGKQGQLESMEETKIEVILPAHLMSGVLRALKKAHPYEEVAYYLNELINQNQEIGSGMIGNLSNPMEFQAFINELKSSMNLQVIKHTKPINDLVQKIAICGGAGSFLVESAIKKQADIFISSDFKYHDFFEANNQITIADIGHYESEVFTKDLIHDYLTQKFANIAFRLSGVITNPITFS